MWLGKPICGIAQNAAGMAVGKFRKQNVTSDYYAEKLLQELIWLLFCEMCWHFLVPNACQMLCECEMNDRLYVCETAISGGNN